MTDQEIIEIIKAVAEKVMGAYKIPDGTYKIIRNLEFPMDISLSGTGPEHSVLKIWYPLGLKETERT